MMRAAVIHAAGGPEVLHLETRPIPTPKIGEVLIRVKAFGINRSEMFTRQGFSPNVVFPRILGIELAGLVESAPGGEFAVGETVASAMGGLGREIDGGYAEYVVVPVGHVQRMKTDLPWEMLGALPEMMETAWGSLFRGLRLEKGGRLLVRGGTTSVGLAAAAIAKKHGAFVASTTRNPERREMLLANGADLVLIDDGDVAAALRSSGVARFDKTLELIGVTTLPDSLRCTNEGGVVCLTGMVGNKWTLPDFDPMGIIPTAVHLTVYAGEVEDFMATPLQRIVDDIAAGTMHVTVGRVFGLEDIVEAHRVQEANTAGGKIVVLT